MTDEKKFRIADFMRTEVHTINKGATFIEALKNMFKNRRNGLVVVDSKRKVVGMLSSLSLIKWLVPDYLEEDKNLAAFEASDIFAKRVKEVEHNRITRFMNHDFHAVKADDSLMKAATLMSEWNTRHLPVVDNKGILVGYITRTDIKLAIAKILNLKRPEKK